MGSPRSLSRTLLGNQLLHTSLSGSVHSRLTQPPVRFARRPQQAFPTAGPCLHRPVPTASCDVVSPHGAPYPLSDQVLLPPPLCSVVPRAPSRLQSAAQSVYHSRLPLRSWPRKLLPCHVPRTARLQRARKQPRSPAQGAPIAPTLS
ncbi:hypothetical protein NDU88_001345 [Pleurodeles waltl]|uniref:Uncharacterized protein n=1 Tax=Pleurodeles waltl TaxID=8319 RepID=A0AAV7MN61_PLEWA|nr:hypothetical protein NDU88_001345 [Pleurodeles waltl]